MEGIGKRSRISRLAPKASATPATIAKLIKKAWPDGVVEMPIGEDESHFWDIYDELKAIISKRREDDPSSYLGVHQPDKSRFLLPRGPRAFRPMVSTNSRCFAIMLS
jgi:hypothetical protein